MYYFILLPHRRAYCTHIYDTVQVVPSVCPYTVFEAISRRWTELKKLFAERTSLNSDNSIHLIFCRFLLKTWKKAFPSDFHLLTTHIYFDKISHGFRGFQAPTRDVTLRVSSPSKSLWVLRDDLIQHAMFVIEFIFFLNICLQSVVLHKKSIFKLDSFKLVY